MVVAYTRRVGQFAKRKSVEAFLRPLAWLYVALMALIYLLGIGTGLQFGRTVALWLVPAGSAVAVVGTWGMMRGMDRLLERFSRRRLALLRGAEAEAYASVLLRDGLGDDWHLWDNLKLDATSDIDHVLIGPGGLFVVSTKSQRGRFILNGPNGPEMNGRPVDWCSDVTRQAMRLKDQLAVVEPARQPWVRAILCLPFAHIEPRDARTGRATRGQVWVVNEDDLIAAVEEWPEKAHRLAKPARARWTAAVRRLNLNQVPDTRTRDDRRDAFGDGGDHVK